MWMMFKLSEAQASLSSGPLEHWKPTTILRSGWRAYELGMVAGEFQLLYDRNPCVTRLRNFLKLRKERKLAEEREERSLLEMSVSHEKSGNARPTEVLRSVPSNGNSHAAEQDDWRQSIAKKPLGFFKRPSTSGTSALKSAVTGTKQGRRNSASPMKPKTRHGKGALDLDSSPAIKREIETDSLASLQRQTTPSEWHPSPSPRPERFLTPSSSPEPAGERPVSPPSTPPLFTPEQPQETQGQEAQVTEPTEPDGEAPPNDAEDTSLMPPTPAQRRRSMPPVSSYSSSLSTNNSRTKATSLPSNVFESSAARRVPLPSVKFKKEACGEILVPSSDSGELVTQVSHEYSSSLGLPRTTTAAVSKHAIASSRLGSSPERVNDSYEAPSSIPERERSQDLNGPRLDELSRMALNGSYPEQVQGDEVQPDNKGATHEEEAARSPSPIRDPEPSYPTLPPSSIPIHSQSPTWQQHSTTTVEETVAVEGTPYRATQDVTTKRARPSPSPSEGSPPPSKRPKLMSHPSRQKEGATPEGLFDAELLKVGIKVNLADYDNNPPTFPWGEGMATLISSAQNTLCESRIPNLQKYGRMFADLEAGAIEEKGKDLISESIILLYITM
ncbi:hypothetical protein EI94DRAFT_326821 [Lactarius quietus]|nr:hypothetical protein EI94DRAFT_326821 [Lactarius quietus]